jgi:1-acyl-sn-glycerol-3-phosphate acyltransferase
MAKEKKPLTPKQLAEIVNFTPKSQKENEKSNGWFNWYFDPQFLGVENIPKDRGVLYVSNHSVYGIADMAVSIGIQRQTDRPLRSLADRSHIDMPGWGKMLKKMGAVLGDPQICSALMEDGQSILVFPGGGREVMKKRKEVYDLVWKERLGFVRLALQHNYDIIPVGVVGGDEMFNFIADSDDFLETGLGKTLDSKGVFNKYLRGRDELPPLVRGIGLSMLPKPHRLFVAYGKPIRLSDHVKADADKKALLKARDLVSTAILDLIAQGIEARKNDPKPTPFLRRLLQNM